MFRKAASALALSASFLIVGLTGNASANVLTGNAGNDTLNGHSGLDTLIGGASNDIYILADSTNVNGSNTWDTVTEAAMAMHFSTAA